MIEPLLARYVESVAGFFPLRRMVVVILGAFLISLETLELDGGAVRSISSFDVLHDFRVDSARVSIGSLSFGLLLVGSGMLFSRVLASAFVFLADRTSGFKLRVKDVYAKRGLLAAATPSDRQVEISILEQALAPIARRLRLFSSLAEICASLGLAVLLCPALSSRLDVLVGAALFFAASLASVRSVQIFIAEYYALSALVSSLQGRDAPIQDEVLK